MAIEQSLKLDKKIKKTEKKSDNSKLTKKTKPKEKKQNIVKRDWYLIDATDKPVGRISTVASVLIRGKNNPNYDPSRDTGNHVVVINAAKIKITGNKLTDKKFYRHSGFVKGLREVSLKELMESKPEEVVKRSIRMMLPKNKLSRKIIKRLKVYSDDQHIHKNVKFKVIENE